MAALVAERPLTYPVRTGAGKRGWTTAAGATLFNRGFVGLNPAGYIKPFVPGDLFLGIGQAAADNSLGADGALSVKVMTAGQGKETLTGVTPADVGKAVYCTTDNDLALSGHPDAFMGRVLAYLTTHTAIVKLREFSDRLGPGDHGSLDICIDFATFSGGDLDEANTQTVLDGLRLDCIGAGITAGASGIFYDEANAELRLLLDNDDEAENITVQTPQIFNITKGVTFEFTGRLKTAGGAATDDLDFGLMGLAGGITDAQRADMNVNTAGLISALFHLNCDSNDVYASSDDNAAPVAAEDTTFNNSLTVNSDHKLIIRPSGVAELWINAVRKLSTTVFSVGAAGLLAAIVNLEKSTGTGVPEARLRKFRAAGAFA